MGQDQPRGLLQNEAAKVEDVEIEGARTPLYLAVAAGPALQRLEMQQQGRGAKIGLDRQEAAYLEWAAPPMGVVLPGREARSTRSGPRPSSNGTRLTACSGVPQGPGTLLPTPIRIMCNPIALRLKWVGRSVYSAALPCHGSGSVPRARAAIQRLVISVEIIR